MITLWAILMWAFELISDPIVGILLPVFYIVFQVAPVEVALGGWLTDTPWIVIGGLIFGQALLRTGLVKRLAYRILLFTGTSFRGIALALALVCTILTPLIPSVMVKVLILTPIAIGLCELIGLSPKDKTASAIMLVVFLALWSPKMAFLTASTDSILSASILQSMGVEITWLGWAKDMLLPALLWTVVSVALVFLLKPKCKQIPKETLLAQYAQLGPMTKQEKKVTVVSVVIIILLLTENLHGIESAWVMVLMGSLCFCPGVKLLENKDFDQIKFSIVFYLAGALAIGKVATLLDIPGIVVDFVYPIFSQFSSLGLVMMIYVFAIIANFALNPLALIGTLMVPVAELTTTLGYSATLGGYAMIMGFNHALLPYEIAPLMLLYAYGWLHSKYLIRIMAVRIGVGLVFTVLVTYPYWHLLGIV